MKVKSQQAQAAAQIRKHLKNKGYEAKVTSTSYSGGNSVEVELYDCSPEIFAEVERFTNQYQRGSFNGMDDSYNDTNRRSDIPQVLYTFVNAKFTRDMWLRAYDYTLKNVLNGNDLGLPSPENADSSNTCGIWVEVEGDSGYMSSIVYRVLRGVLLNFWDTPNT